MNYSNFEQGNIVILPVPFSNLENAKLRPAIIISNNNFNSKYPDVIALKITSIGHSLPFDVLLKQNDLDKGDLLKESTINCAFVMTIDKKLINQIIGKIKEPKLIEVKQKLKELFT